MTVVLLLKRDKSSVDMFLFRKHKSKTLLKRVCERERAGKLLYSVIQYWTDFFLEDMFNGAFLHLAKPVADRVINFSLSSTPWMQ
jgi:hypothetical protein